jgi:phosphoribosyl-ATP pyrophosphohydrolase
MMAAAAAAAAAMVEENADCFFLVCVVWNDEQKNVREGPKRGGKAPG